MTSTNDLDLLGEFTRDQSQDAFTALVQRHLNLVYCAALRQVRSPQLAEEVAQSVFTDLARNAVRLKPETILTAWLYEVTRRTAINVVRGEARRQLREQIGLESERSRTAPCSWSRGYRGRPMEGKRPIGHHAHRRHTDTLCQPFEFRANLMCFNEIHST